MSCVSIQADDGVWLSALDDGPRDAPVLVVVHPGGGGPEAYEAVAGHLVEELRVIRVRRRRYVSGAVITCSMQREADDVVALASMFDEPVHLFGHSSGAVAALEAASTQPGRFAELIAYEPPLPTSDLVAGAAGERAHRALDAGDPVEAMRIHLREIAQIDASFLDDVPDETLREALGPVVAAQLADNDAIDTLGLGIDRYADLDLPVFLIQGETSPQHLRRRLAQLAEVVPNASTVTLPGQGHVAHLTDPAALAAQIVELIHRV